MQKNMRNRFEMKVATKTYENRKWNENLFNISDVCIQKDQTNQRMFRSI